MTRLGSLVAMSLAASFTALGARELQAQEWRTTTLSRQAAGIDSLAVSVTYGAGRVRIRPVASGPLYRMNVRYAEDGLVPVAEYTPGRLRLGIEGEARRIPFLGDRSGGELDLDLAQGVLMDLKMDLGAVRADLDLGRLSLTGLQLRTGASETRLDISAPNPVRLPRARMEVGAADFTALRLGNLNAAEIDVSAGVGKVRLELTGDWARDAQVNVHMGLGSLELVFPETLGVHLVRHTFLTSFDSEGLVKRGASFYSPNWDTATRRVTVDVNAAFGSIKVLWVR